MKRFIIYGYVLILSGSLYSQGHSNAVFPALTLHSSARLASLGSNFATFHEADINTAISNASLISPVLNNSAMLHYADYFSAYANVQTAYIRDLSKVGTFLASIQYLNYGLVEAYDEYGNYLGPSNLLYNFIANVGWGRSLVDSVFSIGANFKYIFCRGTNFWSNGIAVDVSGSYMNIEKNLAVSFAARNIGTALKRDFISDYDNLPFQIDLAIYQRMQHAPFAYSLVFSNLQKWNLSGIDLNEKTIDPVTGEITTPNKLSAIADNAMRHFIPAVEIFPFKNFSFRLSYNYHRRQELKTVTRPGFVGFSWGLGVKIYKLQIDYARSTYHLAGAPNFITISANLSDFTKN
ncbi:MAG: type IX secretion system protein PorQ [Bacteroidales bacterium]|jgi:hypothetical protein|nr:type IX secretion system protein PorQ [Bacteroidales bacterium]